MNNKILVFVISILVFTAVPADAIHTPGVSHNGGAATLMLTNDNNIALGGEFGVNPNLALVGNFNLPFSRIGVKYQIDSNLALLGGVSSNNNPYLGLNGSRWINRDLTAIYELNLLMGNNLVLPYELGARFNLDHNLDLRAGIFGRIDEGIEFPSLKAGIGYRF